MIWLICALILFGIGMIDDEPGANFGKVRPTGTLVILLLLCLVAWPIVLGMGIDCALGGRSKTSWMYSFKGWSRSNDEDE